MLTSCTDKDQMELMQMLVRRNAQHGGPVRRCDAWTAVESTVWLPPAIKLNPVLQERGSHLYLISLESLAYSSMAYVILFWQINTCECWIWQNNLLVYNAHPEGLCPLLLYRCKQLWRQRFESVLWEVPAVLRESSSVEGQECFVETGSPSDSCRGACRRKNPTIVF